MRNRTLVALLVTCSVVSSDAAENWPHWRGPSRNGISTEKNLPVKWSQTENVAWKLPMPALSGSTPIIWGDRIFLNVADALPDTGTGAEPAPLVRRSRQGDDPLAAAARRRQPTCSGSRTGRRRRPSPTAPASG